MKKTFLVLFSLFLILGAFIIEGGPITTLFCFSAFVPIFLGTLITTLFSFSWAEIKSAFQHAFAGTGSTAAAAIYQRDLQVIRSMSGAIMIWAITMIILAFIAILSMVTEINEIGPHVAVAFTSLLYAFTTRAVLLFPMEIRLKKMVLQPTI